MFKSISAVFLTGLVLACVVSGHLFAQEAKKPWSNSAEVSYVNSSGNTVSRTTSAKNAFLYNWKLTSLEVVGSALGSSNKDRVTAEQYSASEKLSRNFSGRNYVFEKFEWYKNRFSGIKNQHTASGGVGRELVKTDLNTLITELGAGYVHEEHYYTDSTNFISGRSYAKYTHKLSATASFSQDGEYLHNFKDSEGYRAVTNSDLIAAVSTNISLKVGYQWKYNNKPGEGYKKTDEITTVALIINY